MGVRGELFSTKVILQNRTYFFNVKENRLGDLYLNIVESKNREEGGFERQSVILFAEDLQDFLQGFDDSLRVLEKAAREKQKETRNREPRSPERRFKEPRSNGFRKAENDRKPPLRQSSGRRTRDDASYAGKPRRSESTNRDQNRDYSKKRVVVKQRKPRSEE
jgi:hypothetical protein